jgi:hypothetical protein
MNPFLAFCLYVAARVFVQYLKFRPKDEQMISSLQFLLAAMHALKRKNPLTESFLVQLDVDLEGLGLDVGQRPLDQARMTMMSMDSQGIDSMKCSPLFEIRDSQNPTSKYNRFGGGVPTFGEKGVNQYGDPRKSSTENPGPGPPFHQARANLNLTDDSPTQAPSYDYLGSTDSTQYNLPNRNRSGPAAGQFGSSRLSTLADSLSPSASEASRSPNMNNDHQSSRGNSQKDSSSHASFTPPSMTDETRHNSLNNSNSPSTTNSSINRSRVPTMADGNVYSMDTNFSNFQTGFMSQPAEASDGMFTPLGAGWEMSGIEITGNTSTGLTPGPTGMTPMPWQDILSGIGTGWNGDTNGGFVESNSNSDDRRNS